VDDVPHRQIRDVISCREVSHRYAPSRVPDSYLVGKLIGQLGCRIIVSSGLESPVVGVVALYTPRLIVLGLVTLGTVRL
jgi:hypothetical protein